MELEPLKTGITKLKLENVKMFKDFEIDLTDPETKSPARWVNLIGNNGNGKTTLLRHISFFEIESKNGNSVFVLNRAFFRTFQEGNITLFLIKNSIIFNSQIKFNVDVIERGVLDNFNIIGIGFNKSLPNTSGFNKIEYDETNKLQSLFDNHTNFSGIEQWAVDKYYKENSGAKNGPLTSKGIVEYINGITKDFGIQIDKIDPEGYFIYKEADQNLKTWQLSDGLQSVIYIVGNILYHLAQTNKDEAKPWELPSVILIDEIDSHLHPQWRRIIPSILQKAFPNAQFIVTTHSPVLVQNSGVNAVTYLLKKQKDGSVTPHKIEDAAAMDIERLMESAAFGLESTYSIAVEEANEKKNQIAYGEDLQLTKGEEKLLQQSRKNVPLNPELEKEILKFLKKNG